MDTKRIILFSVLMGFWIMQFPALGETSVDAAKLRKSSDKFIEILFSQTDKKPTKETYLCVYELFENIPDNLKKILAEKGVEAGFDSMPKAQRKKYQDEEQKLVKGAMECAMDTMVAKLASKIADDAAAPLWLKAYDSAAKADIYNVRLACLNFWKKNRDGQNCALAGAKKNGYVQNKEVEVWIFHGLKKGFSVVGKHVKSDTQWKIGIPKQFLMKTKDSEKFIKYTPEKPSALQANSFAKSQLHNLYLACKAFWANEGHKNKCSLKVAQRPTYGFILSPLVKVKILKFQEATFEARAIAKEGDGYAWKIKPDSSIHLFLAKNETANSLEKKRKESDLLDPLQLAVTAGRKDLVKELIKKGHDPEKYNWYGDSALLMAAVMGDRDIMALLLRPGTDLNLQNRKGLTPLHLAASRDDQLMAALLLEKGADPNIKDQNGKSALGVAIDGRHKTMIRLLKAKGAKEESVKQAKTASIPKKKEAKSYKKIGQSLGGLFFTLGTLEASASHCAKLAMYREYFNGLSKNALTPASHDVDLIKNFFSLYEKHKGSGLAKVLNKVLDHNRKSAFKSAEEAFQKAESNSAKAKLCSGVITGYQSGAYNMPQYAGEFFNAVQTLNPISFNAANKELDDLQLFKVNSPN